MYISKKNTKRKDLIDIFLEIVYALRTMVNRMRHNRSQRGSTRSHHFLKNVAITKCPDCGSTVMRHQACSICGKYKGKVIINLEAKTSKKTKAKKSEKKAE